MQVEVTRAWLETLLKVNNSLKVIAEKIELTEHNYMLISQIHHLCGYVSSAELILKTHEKENSK